MSSIIAIVAGCGGGTPSSQLPWLGGTRVLVVTDTPSELAERDALAYGATAEAAYGALEVRGDLSGDGATETIIASYGLGIIVLDPTGHALARTKPFVSEGSADGVVALAIVDGPTLAVAVQAGGHRESEVTLSLYRIGEHGLQTLVALPVEEHEGEDTRAGGMMMTPLGFIYRAPGAASTTTWRYDAHRVRYIELPARAAPLN
ncbi:MAG: hypothetical protein ABJE66_00065 [Deltaproteobacteria bacterium]